MSFHHRRLPHHYPPGRSLFITAHLFGSLPSGRFPPPHKLTDGEVFASMDRYLERRREGPWHLHDPRIAVMVVESLRHHAHDMRHYDLGAYVLMGNHIHLLLTPLVPPSRLLQSLKGWTARQANRILRLTGQPFWQHESYDHWVRDEAGWNRIKNYIERNPVRAGLVERPELWPWSSAAGQ